MTVGDKIVCIDDTIKGENLFATITMFPDWIKKDATYTIRQINDNDGIVTGLLLEEKHNPPVHIPILNRVQEPAFATWRFRPLTYQEMEQETTEEQMDEVLETMLKEN